MPVTTSAQVRFVDLDGMGHVNNSVFLSYCELARMDFFRKYFKIVNPFDFPFILARAEVDYLRPLSLSVPHVAIELGVSRIGNSSWDFTYTVKDPADGTVFARVITVQVAYDYEKATTVKIPAEIRSVLEQDYANYEKPG